MLSEQQLEVLLNILQSTKSFEAIGLIFKKCFGKPEQFKAACVICTLIEGNLLTQTQRLVGFYLLYDFYRHESLPTTPFQLLLIEIVEKTTDQVELKFLLHLISSVPKELPKQSAQSFKQSCDPSEQPTLPDLAALRRMRQERAPGVSKGIGLRPVIKDDSEEGYWVLPDSDDAQLGVSTEELTLLSLEPAWARCTPPLLEPTIDEPFWLSPPQLLSEPLWDYTMCALHLTPFLNERKICPFQNGRQMGSTYMKIGVQRLKTTCPAEAQIARCPRRKSSWPRRWRPR